MRRTQPENHGQRPIAAIISQQTISEMCSLRSTMTTEALSPEGRHRSAQAGVLLHQQR
ncbi:hypothetical protein ANCCAN_30022 [Ancylostoma caninum]|uniref:Uncharacterized protein n=1 Tax=Ancylostoma caninum TaxID=29170 RepID=A0A368EX64_ANCCA|nr:hypothetical protein ANCCAN_30022 [Ancylostoma caninum]